VWVAAWSVSGIVDHHAICVYPVSDPSRQLIFTKLGSVVIAHRKIVCIKTWFQVNI